MATNGTRIKRLAQLKTREEAAKELGITVEELDRVEIMSKSEKQNVKLPASLAFTFLAWLAYGLFVWYFNSHIAEYDSQGVLWGTVVTIILFAYALVMLFVLYRDYKKYLRLKK